MYHSASLILSLSLSLILYLLYATNVYGLYNEDDTLIRPFRIHFNDSQLSDIAHRLELARYTPSYEDIHDWRMGLPTRHLHELVEYWKNQYNWRSREEEMNTKYQHFTTKIDNLDIHFIHHRSKHPNAVPLLMSHGWPGTFLECTKIIPYLVDNDLTPAYNVTFDLICPSLPGYVFSGKPRVSGWNADRIGDTFHKLMVRLGYTDGYVVQGGDWGAVVSLNTAMQHHDVVKGMHITFTPLFPPIRQGIIGLIDTLLSNVMPSFMFRKQRDAASVANTAQQLWDEAAYLHQQATRPDTIGAVLNQSPVALLAWYAEKLHAWSDSRDDVTVDVYEGNHFPNGNLYARWTKDEIIDFVMLYWCTDTITSSIRLYWEQFANHPTSPLEQLTKNKVPKEVPSAVAKFAAEPLRMPERWLKYYMNLQSYNEYERGGHFASWEEPELLANDIKQFVMKAVKISTPSKTTKQGDGETLRVEVGVSTSEL